MRLGSAGNEAFSVQLRLVYFDCVHDGVPARPYDRFKSRIGSETMLSSLTTSCFFLKR
jgi:hypothetical protein